MKDSSQEMPGVTEVAKFLDKLKAGSVRDIGRGGESANGTGSGDTGSAELASREEGGEVSVTYEGLGTKSEAMGVQSITNDPRTVRCIQAEVRGLEQKGGETVTGGHSNEGLSGGPVHREEEGKGRTAGLDGMSSNTVRLQS